MPVCLSFCLCNFRPYRRDSKIWRIHDFDNRLEFVVLTTLSLLSCYSIMRLDWTYRRSAWENAIPIVVYALVSALTLGIYLYQFIVSWRNTLRKAPRRSLATLWFDRPGEDSEATSLRLRCNRQNSPLRSQESSLSSPAGSPYKRGSSPVCGMQCVETLIRGFSFSSRLLFCTKEP